MIEWKRLAVACVVLFVLSIAAISLKNKHVQLAGESSAVQALLRAFTDEFERNGNFASDLEQTDEGRKLTGDAYTKWIKIWERDGKLDPVKGDALKDSWGNEYSLVLHIKDGQSRVSAGSSGPDGLHGTKDDIVSEIPVAIDDSLLQVPFNGIDQ